MPILNVENIASTTEITENGLHDVAQYTTADVNVSPSITSLNVTPTTSAQTITAPAGTDGYSPVNVSAVTSSIDANIQAGNIKDGVTILGVTGNYQGGGGTQVAGLVLSGTVTAGGTMSSVSTVKFVGVRYISGFNTFNSLYAMGDTMSNLNSVDMSVLEGIGNDNSVGVFQQAFSECASLSSVDLSSLQYMKGSYSCDGMFNSCSSLSSVNFSSLVTINGSSVCSGMFNGCSSLDTVQFPLLQYIKGSGACQYMFADCVMLESMSFPAIKSNTFGSDTDQFVGMFDGCPALTEIHFPSNVQSVIEGLDGYDENFGAENATIYFDLAATE